MKEFESYIILLTNKLTNPNNLIFKKRKKKLKKVFSMIGYIQGCIRMKCKECGNWSEVGGMGGQVWHFSVF